MEDISFYEKVRKIDNLQVASRALPDLEAYVRENIPHWAQISNMAGEFCQELNQFSQDYLAQRKRKHKHRIEDYWTPEKTNSFDATMTSLGLSDSSDLAQSAIRSSRLYIRDGRLYAIADKNADIFGGAFAGGFMGAICGIGVIPFLMGIQLALTHNLDNNYSVYAGLAGGIIIGARKGIKWEQERRTVEEPFKTVVDSIENRVEYIGSKINELF